MLLAAAGQLGQDLEYVVTEDERKADPAPPLDMKAASQAHAVAAQSTYPRTALLSRRTRARSSAHVRGPQRSRRGEPTGFAICSEVARSGWTYSQKIRSTQKWPGSEMTRARLSYSRTQHIQSAQDDWSG